MPSREFHHRKRAQLLAALDRPALLMAGGFVSRNYPANVFGYRADSTFLYFFDRPEPDSAALFDPAAGEVTLFLPARTAEDALWHGPQPSFEVMRERHGVDRVLPVGELEEHVRRIAGDRPVDALAVADPKATARAAALTGVALDFATPEGTGRPELVLAIAALRIRKDEEEIAEMRRTAVATRAGHLAAMAHTRPGNTEQDLAGRCDGAFARHGCTPAYETILSVRGEVLHNHDHSNALRAGDIVLLDAGAEAQSGYCSDVTRCWPVGGAFSAEAGEIYDVVLRAEKTAIDSVKPGVRYRDLHLLASQVIAEGLVELGLLRGNPSALVESGAHAVFFPHGVGHLIGIDVHDMEGFGDQVHYPSGRTRSGQFGTGYLRLDVDLEPGMTFTIEPGVYFVPAILHGDEFRSKFKDQVDFARAERYLAMNDGRGFGGIRIEDDVLTTGDGHEVLTAAIAKERAAVEALVDSAG